MPGTKWSTARRSQISSSTCSAAAGRSVRVFNVAAAAVGDGDNPPRVGRLGRFERGFLAVGVVPLHLAHQPRRALRRMRAVVRPRATRPGLHDGLVFVSGRGLHVRAVVATNLPLQIQPLFGAVRFVQRKLNENLKGRGGVGFPVLTLDNFVDALLHRRGEQRRAGL